MKVCEYQSERGKCRLQERCKTRRDVLLAPKHQTVVEAKRKNPADGKQDPITTHTRKVNTTQPNDEEKNGAGDHKPDACKGEWRQITETELDEQPGRSPDAAKYQPNETCFHRSFPIADCQLPICSCARIRNQLAIGIWQSAMTYSGGFSS